MTSMTTLTGQEIADQGLEGWANLLGGLQTRIHTPDFATGIALVNAIAAQAERLNHHPDLDLRFSHLDIRLSSHDVGGVTERDVELARLISDLTTSAKLETDSTGVSRLELALDSPQFKTVLPFWAAVLDVEHQSGPDSGDEVRDPYGVLPTVWFQESGREEPRQRWHPDVWVDPAEVGPRIEAARAAGGTLVSDNEAPAFWVLADPEGNKVCLCTWQERG